jgi:hypothetical protein
VVWTILLVVYVAVMLLGWLLGAYMILRGKSGVDLIVGGVVWPFLLLLVAWDKATGKRS